MKSAAAQVNMSSESPYTLRRVPDAEGFSRAWEAALDMGVLRLKDEAFERALHGELVPSSPPKSSSAIAGSATITS